MNKVMSMKQNRETQDVCMPPTIINDENNDGDTTKDNDDNGDLVELLEPR